MFADPNILYLILLVGLWTGVTATYVPGTGVIEIISIGLTLFASWMLATLGVNWWALGLLILGTVGFLVMPFVHRRYLLLAGIGLILQVVGSLFLLPTTPISPVVIAATTVIALLFHQFALRPALLRTRALPVNDEDSALVGARGRVITPLTPVGAVQLRGETWTARSDRPVEKDEEVVVIERDGLMLHVESVKRKNESSLLPEEL
jgi:membrane-bound serine protease (ClpP class)